LELSKKREMYDDLAIILWHSYGMDRYTAWTLQDIVTYP
jgi:hypothetical protein